MDNFHLTGLAIADADLGKCRLAFDYTENVTVLALRPDRLLGNEDRIRPVFQRHRHTRANMPGFSLLLLLGMRARINMVRVFSSITGSTA